MQLYPNTYYHLYNRTNANERLFIMRENYMYFLKKYRFFLAEDFSTLAYCLMPTHFHAFIFVKPEGSQKCSKRIGTLLSSYTQAFNKVYKRHGSLFQQHSHAKPIDSMQYAATLTAYIHNNPLRSGLVSAPEEWEFSSYQDYCGLRKGTLVEKELVLSRFATIEEFRQFSEGVQTVEERFWV
jgi:REP element-mobilizing transposase RayT